MTQVDQLYQRLISGQDAVLAVVAAMTSDQWQIVVAGEWRVRDVLAHLAASELGHCHVIRSLVANGPTDIADFDLDGFNAAEVAARRSLPVSELVTEYRANRAATLALLRSIGENDWEKEGQHPGGFSTTVSGTFRVIAIHEKRHLKEWQAAL